MLHKRKAKKKRKEIPCPADLVFLGDFTYVDYGREALTNYRRPNYGRTSLTIYGRETHTNYGRLNYGRTSRVYGRDKETEKREGGLSPISHHVVRPVTDVGKTTTGQGTAF